MPIVQADPALFIPYFQVRYRVEVGLIFQKLKKGILRYLIVRSFGFPLFPHHVFHPRDLHFLKNSPKRRKYCFSVILNSLFICLRSLAESCRNQNPVILNVSDTLIENISGLVSGLCGRQGRNPGLSRLLTIRILIPSNSMALETRPDCILPVRKGRVQQCLSRRMTHRKNIMNRHSEYFPYEL